MNQEMHNYLTPKTKELKKTPSEVLKPMFPNLRNFKLPPLRSSGLFRNVDP